MFFRLNAKVLCAPHSPTGPSADFPLELLTTHALVNRSIRVPAFAAIVAAVRCAQACVALQKLFVWSRRLSGCFSAAGRPTKTERARVCRGKLLCRGADLVSLPLSVPSVESTVVTG
jgi:hypothetical protein